MAAYSDARHEAGLDKPGAYGGGRSNGAGSYNGQGRPNPAPAATTAYGAPIHTGTDPTKASYGISVAKSPAAWAALNDQVNTYNQAARKWNAGTGPSLANTINAFAPMGMSMQAPEFGKPKTYVGGDYHLGLNPGDLAGGLLGGMAGPGVGLLTGPLAGKLYSMTGAPNLMLGGGQVPGAWAINGPHGAPSMPGTSPQQLGNPTENNGEKLSNLASLNQNIPGNSGAPVSSGSQSGTTTPPPTPSGPTYIQRQASLQQIYPGYGVQLPAYQYLKQQG